MLQGNGRWECVKNSSVKQSGEVIRFLPLKFKGGGSFVSKKGPLPLTVE